MWTPDLQYDFTVAQEGLVDHLYLDTMGVPTCGVGFAIFKQEDLKKFAWKPSLEEAELDYRLLKESEKGKGMAYYRRITHARLSQPSIKPHFADLMLAARKRIRATWGMDQLPDSVQVCLLDIAHQVGVGGLDRFVKLKGHVLSRDWSHAAQQVGVRQASTARTLARQQLMLQAIGSDGSTP